MHRSRKMEIPLAVKSRSKFWFVFLVSNFICLSLISYSSLICSKIEPLLINNFVNAKDGNKASLASEQLNGEKEKNLDLCLGRYIYIHDLPSQFNEDILKDCHSITRIIDRYNMCLFIQNLGFGPRIENSYGVLSNTSWFFTNQFFLEVIFHTRIKKYECLTNDSSLASAIFVPFYAGLDLRRYLWGYKTSARDLSGLNLVSWLVEKPEWKKMWGMDHFLVSGRISRDFMRKSNNEFGSNFRLLPESKNLSMLAIESISLNDLAVPYPTSFHPSKDSEVFQWQDRMRRQKRQYLFSFAGGGRPRSSGNSIRGKIIDQCLASGSACRFLNCSLVGATDCDNPVNVMKVFQSSVFCLQPTGDSFTRRSTFDSLLAGCIPVFFHPGSAYMQYKWHLPENYTTYSVYIPEEKMKYGNFSIIDTLLRVSKDEEKAIRDEVIRLIPKIIYADSRTKLQTLEDAFDIAVKGILERIETTRRAIREGRDPSTGFSETRMYG